MQTGNHSISRRALLKSVVTGAAMAPLALLAPPMGLARAHASARPLPAAEFDAGVVTAWCDELLALVRATPGYSPPVAARAFGYAGIALYESLLPGMPEYRSLSGLVTDLPELPATGRNAAYAWPVVASAALADVARTFFPGAPPDRLLAVDRLEAAHATTAPLGIRERSMDRGRAVAQAIYQWSSTDGGHEGYLHNFQSSYVAPVGAGLWQPTPPAFQPPLQPSWGGNRMFVAQADASEPEPPPTYSTDPASACFVEALEVLQTVNALDAEQLEIARFWADDPGATATPPGHSLSIFVQVARTRDITLVHAAEALAQLGIAVSDAFVACWRTKYTHNLLRPLTYIRATIDPSWGDPLPLVTPPFPEYTSGHSVQSGAAATVLAAAFGPTTFTDRTHEARGMAPRTFTSFEAAAQEAAISRLYGGIHFRAAIERGLEQGSSLGRQIAALRLSG